MKCSYCGKKAYVLGSTYYAGYTMNTERTLREDDVLGTICSHCEGQYETIRIRSMVMRGMGIQQARKKIKRQNQLRGTAWTMDQITP